MRKLLLMAIFGLSASAVMAQTSAGNMMIGGSFRFNSDTRETAADDLKSSYFGINPSFGYFISDGLAVGANLSFDSYKYTNDDKQTILGFGPFVRYYKFIADDKFAFTGTAGFNIGSGKYDPNTGNETKTGSLNVYVSPGFAYFFSPKWSLDFQLQGISFNSFDPDKDADNDKIKSFNFGASSLSPSLGFRYFLGN